MPQINLHHLHIFWIFAKSVSFTKTANELSIAQSAVTAQIKLLEQALGLSLIDRSRQKNPEITSEGRKVLAYADSIFEASQELARFATEGENSAIKILKIGALAGLSRNLQYEFLSPTVGLAGIKVEVTTGDQDNLVELLKKHRIDVILSSHNVKSMDGAHFYSHVLTASPIVFVISQGQKTASSVDLKALLRHRPLYLPGPKFEVRPELDAYLEGLNCNYNVTGEIDDIALLRIFALRSNALVAIPEMGVSNDLNDKTLRIVKKLPTVQQRFYAITRQRQFANQTIEKLIKAMRS